MKAIRATQSESWHTSFERENVHNSSRCSMKLPGRRGLPGTPAICIRVPRSELLYSHSLLRFLQVFSHLVVKCFMPAPSSLGMSRTTPFSNKRSNAASALVTSRSGSTLQGSPSNSTNSSTVMAQAPPSPGSGWNRTFFFSGNSPGRAFDSRISPYWTVSLDLLGLESSQTQHLQISNAVALHQLHLLMPWT